MIIKMPIHSILQYTLKYVFPFTTKFPALIIYYQSKDI